MTTQIYDHQTNITQGGVPILVLDAWEHAFYLQYGPDKKSFFEAVWNIWNWQDVGQRFEKVRGLDLESHLLGRDDDVPPRLLSAVHRRQVEVGALVVRVDDRLAVGVAAKQEELGLRARDHRVAEG